MKYSYTRLDNLLVRHYTSIIEGDVIFVSFNNASRDEDNILDQIHKHKANMFKFLSL